MPEDKRGSLATLVDAPSEVDWSTMQLPEDLPMFRAAPMSLFPNADLGNDPEVIGADIPAGGKTSARAIAKMYAALLTDVDGLRLISPERLEQAATLAVEGKDEVFGDQVRWTLGYALGGPSVEERSKTTFGMGGVGGSWAAADPATGTSLAVTKNLLTQNSTLPLRLPAWFLHETRQLITVQLMDRAESHAAVHDAWTASGVGAVGLTRQPASK